MVKKILIATAIGYTAVLFVVQLVVPFVTGR